MSSGKPPLDPFLAKEGNEELVMKSDRILPDIEQL